MIKNIWITFIIFICFLFPSIEITRPFHGILLQRAMGNDDMLQISHLKHADLLTDLIIIPEQVNNTKELNEMITRINEIDKPILQLLVNQGVKIRLFQGKLTDEPLLFYLKWDEPRGWEQKVSWEQVPGSGGSWLVSAKIGASKPGNGHSSINLELHEIGHTVYKLLISNSSIAADLQRIWKSEVNNIFPEQSYFINYCSEYFAEMFAMYYLNEASSNRVKTKAPKTYDFFQQLSTFNLKKVEQNYFHGMLSPVSHPKYLFSQRASMDIFIIFG